MSKAHRGVTLRKEKPKSGRGVCPICKREGVKIIYEYDFNEKKYLICKQCKAGISHGKLKDKLS